MKTFLTVFMFINFLYANISVSILPQKYVIDKITNNSIDVNVMIPRGASPATYSPKPKQLLSLKRSKIYFSIGVPFEKAWLPKFTSINPNIKIVYFGKNLKNLDKNPHIWLDPIFLISEAEIVYKELSKLYPKREKEFKTNFLKFKTQLQELDNYAKTHLHNQKFIIFHPNLHYFAKRYHLKEIAIEKEGKEPTLRYLLKIIKIAKKENIKIVFTAPEFSHKNAQFLANKIGGKVVKFSALEYNIIENLKKVIKILNENS
jgi:zinc transport system substrate-binding protein